MSLYSTEKGNHPVYSMVCIYRVANRRVLGSTLVWCLPHEGKGSTPQATNVLACVGAYDTYTTSSTRVP